MRYADNTPAWQVRALVPALVCAVLSAVLMRGGFWSILFLIPLGFMAFAYSPGGAWLSWAAATLLNIIVTVFLYRGAGFEAWFFSVAYFTTVSLGFTWIMCGGQLRTAYRFIIASCAGAAAFLLPFLNAEYSLAFREMLTEQARWLSQAYISSAGADVVQQSLLKETLSPESMVRFIIGIMLRGGALVSCFLLLFFSRQTAAVLAGLARKRRFTAGLITFHAPKGTIWVLSVSLGLILLFRRMGGSAAEIAAWNMLVICGMLFLAQGAGIALYAASRWRPALRLLCNVLVIMVILSPGINAVALGILILLGIAENWLPLRAPKNNAPTPGQ